MTLEFKILWFDDQPDDEVVDFLESKLKRKGFKLNVTWVTSVPNIKTLPGDLRSKPEPDLVLLDWKMKDDLRGDAVAKIVRREFQHTDMIFYSSENASVLRRLIFDQDIDGVYCTDRKVLMEETWEIIYSLLKKALDVNHMRGIVMATVGGFDHKINDCISAWHSVLDTEEQAALRKAIIKRMEKSLKDGAKKVANLDPDHNHNFPDLLTLREFTTDHRRRTLYSILENHSKDRSEESHIGIFASFKEKIIDPRNDLAHAIESIIDGEMVLINGESLYDESRFDEIRIDLHEHADNLEKLLVSIQLGDFAPTDE